MGTLYLQLKSQPPLSGLARLQRRDGLVRAKAALADTHREYYGVPTELYYCRFALNAKGTTLKLSLLPIR